MLAHFPNLFLGLREVFAHILIDSKYSCYLCNDIGRFSEIVTSTHTRPSQEVFNQANSDIVSPSKNRRTQKKPSLTNQVLIKVRECSLLFTPILSISKPTRTIISFTLKVSAESLNIKLAWLNYKREIRSELVCLRESNLAFACIIFDSRMKKIVFQQCCQTQCQWDYWISSRHGYDEKTTHPKITCCPTIF